MITTGSYLFVWINPENAEVLFPHRQLKPHTLYVVFQHSLDVTYQTEPHVHLLEAHFLVETIVGSLVRIQACSLYTNIKHLLQIHVQWSCVSSPLQVASEAISRCSISNAAGYVSGPPAF